jgi:hypothetical protein
MDQASIIVVTVTGIFVDVYQCVVFRKCGSFFKIFAQTNLVFGSLFNLAIISISGPQIDDSLLSMDVLNLTACHLHCADPFQCSWISI